MKVGSGEKDDEKKKEEKENGNLKQWQMEYYKIKSYFTSTKYHMKWHIIEPCFFPLVYKEQY